MLKAGASGGAATKDMLEQDVGFQMMKKLIEAGERPKQLKIVPHEKLLLLKEEAMSEAFVESLVRTARGFGSYIQKIVLDNVGMKDDEFARLLKSIGQLKSFKSIVYRKNALGEKSAAVLSELFKKKIPNHLEELRIENCHPISATSMETIVEALHAENSLKILGLVRTPMSTETFLQLALCIKNSSFLTEIDISDNQILDPTVYVKMLKAISKNDKLRALNFSHNNLMPSDFARNKDPESRQQLNDQEKRVYKYLVKIMLKNNVMEHIHLTNCSLSTIMILKIANRAKTSKSL